MSAKGYICSSKTKQRIYRVAADLFLKNGYQNTTLSDIAKKAEVSTGTLYRYYPSKGDFLTEIGKNSVEHLRAFADDLPEDMPASEAVLAVLLEDIRGTQGIFFSPEGAASHAHTSGSRRKVSSDRPQRHRISSASSGRIYRRTSL